MIRGDDPTTVLGVLMMSDGPVLPEHIAITLDVPVDKVHNTVDMLEDEELCVQVIINGLRHVQAFAAYSALNE
jgi:hypothetical protein